MLPFGFSDEGSGEPVLWLHSSGTSRRQWRRMIDALPGFRHLSLDLWGYGETPMPDCSPDFSLNDEAALAERLLERFAGPCRLVGHSYGGAVALKIAQRNPSRVRSVFAFEPVLFHLLRDRADAAAERAEVNTVSQRTADLVAAGDLRGASENFVRYWTGDRAWESLSEERREQWEATAPKAACDFAALENEATPAECYLIRGITIRIASGELSPAPVRKVAAILGDARQDALEVLPGVGHMAPITHPDPVVACLLRHWAEEARL